MERVGINSYAVWRRRLMSAFAEQLPPTEQLHPSPSMKALLQAELKKR